MSKPWIVLKFGGTSVASASNWQRIADRVRNLLPDHRVWIVASALSQVSNHLERAVDEALNDKPPESLAWIREAHRKLAAQIGLDAAAVAPVEALLDDLGRLLEGIRLTREASPRLRARVMSFGELASTYLGLATLQHHGFEVARADARSLLTTRERKGASDDARYLQADVQPRKDAEACDAAAKGASVVITQGFIAANPKGETCLLGRGGSDTSAALFAALTAAISLEIWTDVHGLFSTDPRQIPAARLIRRISYREAQELAAMGAKVLHPRCLGPVAWAGIPIDIRNTLDPHAEGTRISAHDDNDPEVMAVVRRSGVTMLTISTLEMWGTSGFLAQVFSPFEDLGISVDLVATSQSAVSVTLDGIPGGVQGEPFAALLGRLGELGNVKVVHPCAVVSIVGRRIRTVLHELGPAFSVFREHAVHLVSESSEDLNLSFVVDETDAAKLVADLHSRLLPKQGGDGLFGPSWELLAGAGSAAAAATASQSMPAPAPPWWRERRADLLDLVSGGEALYVYDLATVRRQARALLTRLPSVDRFYYAMKANSHARIIDLLAEEGLGLECVSAAEIGAVREQLGDDPAVLFTPNFCPTGEYGRAYDLGADVIIDGPQVLAQAPGLFAGRKVGIRVDPGKGLGHHEKVRTAGANQKFGLPIEELGELLAVCKEHRVTVTGLHAHVGSGILEAGAWKRNAELFARLREQLPDLLWVDVGGGLGVVERPGQDPLDLDQVEEGLAAIKARLGGLELRMEPGRFLVSEAGVLLAPVTQVRRKGEMRFVGAATGMNSLLRPALYGAWHGIHNLTRIDEPATDYWHVVGPICETGDVLGRDRLLPETVPGDVLLLENCGAYGRVMASDYNMRPPARELCLPLRS